MGGPLIRTVLGQYQSAACVQAPVEDLWYEESTGYKPALDC